MQTGLFDSVRQNSKQFNWDLPNLKGQNKLYFDTESTGLRVFSGDKAVGLSVSTVFGQSWYLPFGHARGFNYELDKIKLWVADNLQGKELVAINTKFDVQTLYNVGIDLEALGCNLRDVAYHAALTNSKRQSYKLADLAKEHSNKRKIELIGDIPIHMRFSEDVYDYACMDAVLLSDIESSLNRTIVNEGLEKVRDLEDSLIYAVAHMERNGAYIDVEKLELWRKLCDQRMSAIFWQLARETSLRIEPSKPDSVSKLVNWINSHSADKITLPITETGKPSVTNEWLKNQNHPLLRLVFDWRKLSDLKSDNLDKYYNCLDRNGKIRYNLNQLKADDYGTVTGRMSSSGSKNPDDDKKINVQQVIDVNPFDDEDAIIKDMVIRELFIPEPNCQWVSADASQLQFRIFAHYSEDERLIGEYIRNPRADFHHVVNKEVLGGALCQDRSSCSGCFAEKPAKGCGRKKAKHENFGNLFGMGIEKGARRLGVSVEEYKTIKAIYNEHFPAAKKLSYLAQGLARHPSLGPHQVTYKIGRGFVRTISGRRRRYDPNDNLNSAVNAVIQGTEADIVKIQLREVYNRRKEIGLSNLYFTVHDSIDAGAERSAAHEAKRKMKEILDDHSVFESAFKIKFKVPIIWDVKTGDNWNDKCRCGQCKAA